MRVVEKGKHSDLIPHPISTNLQIYLVISSILIKKTKIISNSNMELYTIPDTFTEFFFKGGNIIKIMFFFLCP